MSVTTRQRRPQEKHGRDYLFITKKQFLYKKHAGHFLESQKVFDNYYGTPKKNVSDLLRRGKNVLLCIDVKGAKVIRRHFPEAVAIFIKTLSLNELKRRLLSRGSEDKKTINLRLKIARQELGEALHYKHIVINDSLFKALNRLKKIITSELRLNK